MPRVFVHAFLFLTTILTGPLCYAQMSTATSAASIIPAEEGYTAFAFPGRQAEVRWESANSGEHSRSKQEGRSISKKATVKGLRDLRLLRTDYASDGQLSKGNVRLRLPGGDAVCSHTVQASVVAMRESKGAVLVFLE